MTFEDDPTLNPIDVACSNTWLHLAEDHDVKKAQR